MNLTGKLNIHRFHFVETWRLRREAAGNRQTAQAEG